ncbi:MAG: serine/threonine-protein phosphatase [Ruminococcus sp.]|nr:serine/threonine-protein phosphatase [Ruminococcus sp.]
MSNELENANVAEAAAAAPAQPEGAPRIRVAAASHNGAVRANNEDNYSINGQYRQIDDLIVDFEDTLPADGLMLEVCDGMGGEAMGEVASEIAVKHTADLLVKLRQADEKDLINEINSYVDRANNEICETIGNTETRRGGSTFVLIYFKGDVVYPYSLGDSRIYAFNGTKLVQISEDHTLGMRKYKSNIITFEEAMTGPDSHKLTLFLGVDIDNNGLTAQPYRPFRVERGWKLLLCSDGLYDMVSAVEIAETLQLDTSEACKRLVERAIAHGGIDNVTVIVAEMI